MAAFRGLVFWYAIEKLFQQNLGFSVQQIVILGVIAQTAIVLFEIPSSVFADRASRKKTLILSYLAFSISCVILGLSTNYQMYIFGIIFWSLSDALFSGVFQAFTYDSLLQIKKQDNYRRIISKVTAIELVVMGAAGFSAGFIGAAFNFQLTFFLSVVGAIAVVFILTTMKEPPISRTSEEGLTWIKHLHEGLKVTYKKSLLWASVGLTLLVGLRTVWYEYYGLIALEVNVPEVIFGTIIAFLTVGLVVGSLIAGKWRAQFRSIGFAWLVFWLSNILLVVLEDYRSVALVMFSACVGLKMIEIYLDNYIQHHVSSSQRATVVSLISTAGHLLFFAMGLAFSLLSAHISVRATFLAVAMPMLVFSLLSGIRRFKDYSEA